MPEPNDSRPTCVIADDHSVVREGLRLRLETDGWVEVVGEAETGEGALELIRATQPDLAIVDIRMPKPDGFDVARAVRAESLGTRIVLYTVLSDAQLIERAFDCGALGYVSKEAPPEVIFRALREIYHGRQFVDPAIATATGNKGGEKLSGREVEILTLLARGYSNTVIARNLQVTPETVKSHVSNVLAKLGAESRTQAVAIAIRRAIIE